MTLTVNSASFTPQIIGTTKAKHLNTVIINEINWAGSSLSSSDEWIELYNPGSSSVDITHWHLKGAGGDSEGIELQGSIEPDSFFLVANFTEEDERSVLRITPGLVTTSVSIRNSYFTIQLLDAQGDLIDEVDTFGKSPDAGSNSKNEKRSMARTIASNPDSAPSTWKSSSTRVYLDNPATNSAMHCGKDYATPGAVNFSDTKNEVVIEAEETCYSTGEITQDDNATYVTIQGEQKGLQAVQEEYVFSEKSGTYSITLYAEHSQKGEAKPQIIGSFGIFFPQNVTVENQRVSNSFLARGKPVAIEFLKQDGLDLAVISFQLTQTENSTTRIDKVIITQHAEIEKEFTLNAEDVYSFTGQIIPDESISDMVLYQRKNKDSTSTNIVESTYIARHIHPGKRLPFKFDVTAKLANVNNDKVRLTDRLATLIIRYSDTNQTVKHIRLKDLVTDKYQKFSLNSVTPYSGSAELILTSYNQADIYLKTVTGRQVTDFGETTIDLVETIHADSENHDTSGSVTIQKSQNKPGLHISAEPDYYCINAAQCTLQISLTPLESYHSHSPLLELMSTVSSDENEKDTYIKRIFPQDISPASRNLLTFYIPTTSFSKVGLLVYNHNLVSIKIHSIKFTPQAQSAQKTRLVSAKGQQWSKGLVLKTGEDDHGIQGQLVDIKYSEYRLTPDTYTFQLDVKKMETFSSKNSLLRVSAYDSRGKKLFDTEIDENDLSAFATTSISEKFTLEEPRRIYIFIRFYGNHTGAFSDISLRQPVLN